MNTFQVLDDRGAPKVEEVLAHAYIASAMALASGDVSERVFYGSALAEQGTAGTGLL